ARARPARRRRPSGTRPRPPAAAAPTARRRRPRGTAPAAASTAAGRGGRTRAATSGSTARHGGSRSHRRCLRAAARGHRPRRARGHEPAVGAPAPRAQGGRVAPRRARGQPQRPVRAASTASAAGPAVELRSTCVPSSTGAPPTAANASTSASLRPPSGPTTTTISGTPSTGTCTSGAAATSCSTSTSAPRPVASATTSTRAWPRTTGSSSGSQDRRATFVAACTIARQRCSPLAALSPRHWTTDRSDCHGRTASTPSSVAASTAISSRSPLASACTSTSRGEAGGSDVTAVTSISTAAGPEPGATSPTSRVPTPSTTSIGSPARSRCTDAACRASGPVRVHRPPAATPSSAPGSTTKTGAVMPRRSATREGVPQLAEHRALDRYLPRLRALLAALDGELAQQPLLLGGEPGRHGHLDVHVQVPATRALQVPDAEAAQRHDVAVLGARPDVDLLDAVERLDRQHGAERRRRHRELDLAVEVVAAAGEQVVLLLADLDIEVAR